MASLGDGPRRRSLICVRDDAGTVTAEVAVVLPTLVLILVVLLAGVAAGATQLSLQEAARAAARDLARGESSQAAIATAHRLAGSEAEVTLSRDGRWAAVQVTTRFRGPVPAMVGWPLGARAEAWLEPGTSGGTSGAASTGAGGGTGTGVHAGKVP